MNWRCEREQCGDTYPHKHLCDCVEFWMIDIGQEVEWVCACWYNEEYDDEGWE